MTDWLIRTTTALAVVAVAVVAATISYQHAYELVRSHGESGLTGRPHTLQPAGPDPGRGTQQSGFQSGLHQQLRAQPDDIFQDLRQLLARSSQLVDVAAGCARFFR